MPGVFLRDGAGLVALRETQYEAESVLQQLLAEWPALLAGGEDTTEWLLLRREAAITLGWDRGPRGSLDHLFVDESGTPTLVEVKRSSDSRVRREVVGQMLDYAANARSHWAGGALRQLLEERFAGDTERAAREVRERFPAVDDVEEFWDGVRANVEAERFRLVFVADEVPQELRRIVEYLNAQMSRTEVLAIEVTQYVDPEGRHQVLVPRLIGDTEAARATKGDTRRWNRATVLDELEERFDDETPAVVRRLLEWADGRPDLILNFGTGTKDGSIAIGAGQDVGYLWPFVIYTYGRIEMQFQPMLRRRPFDSSELREQLRQKLLAIPGMRLPPVSEAKRPSFEIALLRSDDAFARFTDTMDWAFLQAAESRSAATPTSPKAKTA